LSKLKKTKQIKIKGNLLLRTIKRQISIRKNLTREERQAKEKGNSINREGRTIIGKIETPVVPHIKKTIIERTEMAIGLNTKRITIGKIETAIVLNMTIIIKGRDHSIMSPNNTTPIQETETPHAHIPNRISMSRESRPMIMTLQKIILEEINPISTETKRVNNKAEEMIEGVVDQSRLLMETITSLSSESIRMNEQVLKTITILSKMMTLQKSDSLEIKVRVMKDSLQRRL
jgi:hypothetical protein